MKHKQIVIGITTVTVLTIFYFAYKRAKEKNIKNDPTLKRDYDEVMSKIRNAKV